MLALIRHVCGKGMSSTCTNTVCEGKGKLSSGTNKYVCVCVGSGDRVIALMNTTYMCMWEGETKCLHSLIRHVCVCRKGRSSTCTH